MKKILFTLIMVFFSISSSKAIVKPTDDFYINDYADILSDDTEKFIMEHSVSLESKTKVQIVVVTVQNLEGYSLEDYANKLFNNFEIGDEKLDNGLLLLLALEERKFRVEVGYGLEGFLTDGLTGRYQDKYIIPYLKEDNWDEGIKNGYSAFYQKICEEYGIDSEDITVTEVSSDDSSTTFMYFVVSLYPFMLYSYLLGDKFHALNKAKIKIPFKQIEVHNAK